MDINEVLLENKPLVVFLANKFKPKTLAEREEYVAAGMIGLWRAALKFDPAKGKLTTIAWYWINREILNHIKKNKKYHERYKSFTDLNSQSYTGKTIYDKENISDIIPNLSDAEAKIIDHKILGRSIKEIAAIEQMDNKHVNKIYCRAIKKIKAANK